MIDIDIAWCSWNVAFGLLIMYFYVIGALVISLCLNVISVMCRFVIIAFGLIVM